jgi:NAD(P)-dependent dehydrogenase (short-subunit alcohol dehydrogenase family)
MCPPWVAPEGEHVASSLAANAGDPPVVLVTGASRGLGRGIALDAAARGYSVAINYASNRTAADETAALCKTCAPRNVAAARQTFFPIQADIASRDDRQRLVGETLATFGRIDALVNNAGVASKSRADITEATEESFAEVLRTNLHGPHFLTQAVVRYWLGGQPPLPILPGGFKIVFITSISADTASTSRGEYCVSKAGLAMSAQLWAARLAAAGILVFEVRPGIMATDMTASVQQKYDRLLAEGIVPQMRWGTPEDTGIVVGSLLAGQFPFSTGAVIPVDGGFHLRRL